MEEEEDRERLFLPEVSLASPLCSGLFFVSSEQVFNLLSDGGT